MHSKIITLVLLVAAAVCHGGAESGEIHEIAGALTFRQALALALTHSPELAAVGYDTRIADATILQAKLRLNPALPKIRLQNDNKRIARTAIVVILQIARRC